MITAFPWEHRCLVWTEFTGSRIWNSSLHVANQILLHKQWEFLAQTNPDEIISRHVCETRAQRLPWKHPFNSKAWAGKLHLRKSLPSSVVLMSHPELFKSFHHKCDLITVSQNKKKTKSLRCYYLNSSWDIITPEVLVGLRVRVQRMSD